MQEYPFHEIANLFPLMSGSEFGELCKDISANGLIEPIWLHDGQIIDGRNRYNACRETGTEAKFREWSGKGSLVGLVISLNLNRRHLTTSQKALIGLGMIPMLAEEAKERQKQAGKLYGENHPKQEVTPKPEEALKGEAVQQAADLIGVGKTTLYQAKKIAQEQPEKIQEIREGKTTVDKVSREMKKEIKPRKEMTRDMVAKPYSNARQFSHIAISQLTRIREEDPQRVAALLEVKEYIDEQLNTIGE